MWRKWFILSSYSALAFANGYAFSNLSPVMGEAEEYFDQSKETLDYLVQVFYIFYFPLAPFSSWLLTRSVHLCILIGWALTVLGMWIKYAAGPRFWIVLVGHSITSMPGPLVLSGVSSVSDVWFPVHQRLLATCIGELSLFLGMGTSFILATHMSINTNFLVQSIAMTTGAALYLVFGKADPKKQERISLKEFFGQVKVLILDKGHFSLVLAVGYLTGLAYSLVGELGFILQGEGIDETQASYTGFAISIAGMSGGLAVAALHSKNVRTDYQFALFCTASGGLSVVWALFAQPVWVTYMISSVLGFCFFGLAPLGLRISVLFSSHLVDAVPSGLVFFLADLFGLLTVYPLTYPVQLGVSALWMLAILMVFGVSSMFSVVCSFRRKILLQEQLGESVSQDTLIPDIN